MSGSISAANILPSGMRFAIRTLKYPVPAPISATSEARCRGRASKSSSGFCQASRSGLSNSLAHFAASSNR